MPTPFINLLAQTTAPDPSADTAQQTGMSLLDFIQAGGLVGYIILILSLAALALLVVHIVRIRAEALAPERTVNELQSLLEARRVDDAINFCANPDNACFLTNIMRTGLLRLKRSPFGALELKATLEEAGQEQVARLSRSTDALALVASIAPMLGLLGTVVGINGAFATISAAQGLSRPDQLAGDISLALVTTIMGLALGIPATAAVTFFRNRIEKLAADIAATIDELAIYLEAPAAATPQTSPTASRAQPQSPQPQQASQPQRNPNVPQPATPAKPLGRPSRPDAPANN